MKISENPTKHLTGSLTKYVTGLLALYLVALLLWPQFSRAMRAAAGDLDSSFDGDGKVTTDFFGGTDPEFWGGFDEARAIAIQPDGKLLVAGETTTSPGNFPMVALARYNPDGSLDTSFGPDHDGRLKETEFSRHVFAMALQADGRIVVGGQQLVRYDASGNLDTTFASPGMRMIFAVAIQPDGRVVVAGDVFNSASGTVDFALARYNTNGGLDSTFGSNGRVLTNFGATDFAKSLAIQPDGRIVVAGETRDFNTGLRRFALARYNTNGSLDTTFGTNGLVMTLIESRSFALALAIQDSKIVAAGSSFNPSTSRSGFALARYNPNGSLDTTFGNNGMVVPLQGSEGEARALAIDAEGKLVAAGYFMISGRREFALVRYNPTDGSPDTNFGPNGNGVLTTNFGGTGGEANALALQPDGKLVAAGTRLGTQASDQDFAVARYGGSGTPPACSLTCPADITTFNDPGQGGALVNYPLPTATTACGPVTCSRASGSFFPVGTTSVNCTEGTGQSCSFNVTVLDNEKPTITTCPANRALTADASCGVLIPDLRTEVIATDNFTPASSLIITQSPPAGTRVGLGLTSVVITVKDTANNTSTCTALVSVVDRTAPTITNCPGARSLTAFGCRALIPNLIGEVAATDCSSYTISQSPAAGTPVAAGTTTPVTLTVADAAGNASTCTATVTVTADADCDGIQDAIDRNKSTKADESQTFSNDFLRQDFAFPATGPTLGTILDRGGWDVGIIPSGAFGVLAGTNGSGTIAKLQACDKPYEIRFNSSGQQAHVACDVQTNLGTRMRVRAIAGTTEVRLPALPNRPGWRTFLFPGSSGPIPFPRRDTIYLGSPITADSENEGNITVEFFDVGGNVIGSLELPPGQTVDIQQGAVSGLSITNLGTVPLTFTLAGVTKTLSPGETHSDPCAGVNQPQPVVTINPAGGAYLLGQATSFTANVTGGGCGPFTFNWSITGPAPPLFTQTGSGNSSTITLGSGFSAPGAYTVSVTTTDSKGRQVYNSTTVKAVAAIAVSLMRDTSCQDLPNGFDVVFTPDNATSSLKAASTNPGGFMYNLSLTNTGNTGAVGATINIPLFTANALNTTASYTSLAGTPAFALWGANPVRVYTSDPCGAGFTEISSSATISITTGSGSLSQPLSASSTVATSLSVSASIPSSNTVWIQVHLRSRLLGTTGWAANAGTAFLQNYLFKSNLTITNPSLCPNGCPITQSLDASFTGTGKRVTGIGGNAVDTNGAGKGGLRVVVEGTTVNGSPASSINPNTLTESLTGFYFVPLAANTNSMVKLYNATGAQVGQPRSFGPVAQDQFVQLNFPNLNPADPVIEGVVRSAGRGVGKVRVELLNVAGRIVSTTDTNAGGYYSFRFSAPGTYTVRVIPPFGYSASSTSATVTVKMFEAARLDFTLAR